MDEHTGRVKSYNPSKGWGFVECPETKEKYGKDILFQSSELCGRDAKPGEEVTFQVKDGRNGPIAVSLSFATEGPSPPAGSYSGSVKSYNPVKGWGFIECAETQQVYGKDMLFQSSELRGREVQKGESVTFNVADGKTGPIAVQLGFSGPARVAAGPRSAARGAGAMPFRGSGGGIGEYVGTVKSYSAVNGYGFVTSDETQMQYGKDMLFRKDELRGYTPSKGEPVAFCVGEGKGGPVAVSLRFPGAWPPAQASPWSAGPSGAPWTSPRFYGAIKSFNMANGWGFVESVATYQMYGKDMFVRLGDLNGLEAVPGTEVVFSIIEGEKGPIATDVAPAYGAGGYGGGFGPARGAKGGRHSPYGPYGPPAGKPAAPPGTGSDQIMCGTVKNFDETKGYGFIAGEGIQKVFGKDVFMARQALQGRLVSPGDQVRFTYEMGLKGPMAVKVEVLPNSSFGEGDETGTVYSGEVKSFNPENGWGFVTSPETMDLFGKDLFLHKRVLPDGVDEVQPGDLVSFSVKLNGARPEVASVSMAAGATA